MLRPSRVVEQRRGIPLFVQKGSSSCSVCGRPLTAHESVARGIGPVCVQKHYGPGPHPSGSPQSVHAGRRKQKPLYESVKGMAIKGRRLTGSESGIEISFVNMYEDGTKVLVKQNKLGLAESELMAYEFSESVGWGIVPETIVPKIGRFADNESVQRWIEGKTAAELFDLYPYAAGAPGFQKATRIVVMDRLFGNMDRHMNNILVDGTGKQWAIDNNRAFWNYGRMARFGRRVPKENAGLIDAAKDVRRWFKTPAYYGYVAKLKQTHGEVVARQFGLNVADLVDWSRKAKVME